MGNLKKWWAAKSGEPKRWQTQRPWTKKLVSSKKEKPKTVNPKDNEPKRQQTPKTMNTKSGEPKGEPKDSELRRQWAQKTTNSKDHEPKKWWVQRTHSEPKRWQAQNTTDPESGGLKGEPKDSKPQRWWVQKTANSKDDKRKKWWAQRRAQSQWAQKTYEPKKSQLSKNRTQKIHQPPKKKTPKNCEPQKTLNLWNNMNPKSLWVLPVGWICWQYGWLFQPSWLFQLNEEPIPASFPENEVFCPIFLCLEEIMCQESAGPGYLSPQQTSLIGWEDKARKSETHGRWKGGRRLNHAHGPRKDGGGSKASQLPDSGPCPGDAHTATGFGCGRAA